MSQVWAVSTNKGGVLKTSITTNLAGVLAKQGKKVLIIDTDNQGNVALSFGQNPDKLDKTIYDVLTDGLKPEEAIINVHNGIDLLPCNDDMQFLEFDVLTNRDKYPKPFSLLKDAISPELRKKYDHILIDSPPTLGLTQGNILAIADSVIIPFQPESYSMRSLTKIITAIADFKKKHNPGLRVLGVVATLVDSRTTLHSEVLKEARQYCQKQKIPMFETVIPRSVRFASSIAYEKLPATLTDANNPLVASYFELYKEASGYAK